MRYLRIWSTVIAIVLYHTCVNGDILLRDLYPEPGDIAPATTIIQAIAEAWGGPAVDSSTIVVEVNGLTITNLRTSGAASIQTLTCIPEKTFNPGSTVSVFIHVEDSAANVAETNYTFTIATDSVPPQFIYVSPLTVVNREKRSSIAAVAQDNELMSTNFSLTVNGIPVMPDDVLYSGSLLSLSWLSDLLPIGSTSTIDLIVYDMYANAATAQWIYVSATTSNDFRDLTVMDLSPAPESAEVISLAPVSAKLITRLDRIISNVLLEVNGVEVDTYITGSEYEQTIIHIPDAPYTRGSQVHVQLQATDGVDTINTSWWFTVGEFSDTGEKGFVLLNLWPLYAGDTQNINLAWAQMRAGDVVISIGTNVIYDEYHMPTTKIYTHSITPAERALLGIPERGSNVIDVLFAYENVTQETHYVHYTVDDLTAYKKGEKYFGSMDTDNDNIQIKYTSKAGDTPVIQGRTIIVEGGEKAKLTFKVKAPKSGEGDGKVYIDTVYARNGLKKLMGKGVSIGEIYMESGGLSSLKLSGGDVGRYNIVAVESNQVNGVRTDFAKNIIVQGGTIYGDIIIKGDPAQKPPKILCTAKKNKMTKEFEGGTFLNACIRTEETDIAQIGAKGGAGFIYEPDVYRQFRTYGTVLAGVSSNYIAQGACSNITPAHAIQKVKIKNGRMMGTWLTTHGAKQKIKCYEPLREDVWYVDGEMKPQWEGE